MRGEYTELSCPFCDKGRIQCWYIPSVTTMKKQISATFGSKTRKSKSAEVWLIKSGCNICGKSQEEVEKELKNKGII